MLTQMVSKVVSQVRNAGAMHWVGDGLPVYQAISPQGLGKALNPFIMLDYGAPYEFKPHPKPRGVGFHPHRGFETVTIAFQGEISHGDSTGETGTIHAGDVQWMTAGSGLEHQEKHSEKFTQTGGTLEMLQLWVNLPKKDKMTPPKYQAIQSTEIPHVEVEGGSIDLIAGNYKGYKGPASTFTPLNMWSVKLNPGASLSLATTPEWVNAIFVRKGSGTTGNNNAIEFKDLVVYSNVGDEITVNAGDQGVEYIVLSGEPIREPMVSMGPMVMNTKDELYQAFEDYDNGKFAGMQGRGTAYDI